jgi:hypothetical protein
MRRSILIVVIVIFGLTASFLAAREPSVQELITRANSAPTKDQPGLYIEIAERQLKSASELYGQGKVEDARAAVSDIVTYSQKAHDTAIQSGKRLKPTEMACRKMFHKLLDLKRTLNFEDQSPVEAAADRLETLAQDLLAHMFGKEK